MSSTAAVDSEYDFSAGSPLLERPSRVRRARQTLTRYLIAIATGVAATLAWQSYGDAIKQTVAARAPELGWSPEVQQAIAASVQQLGWTKPAEPDKGAPPAAATETSQQATAQQGVQAAFDGAASKPSASPPPTLPSPTLEQVQQIASDLAALKQAVDQLSSHQEQMAQDIAKVQATDQEVLNKVSANKVAADKAAANNKIAATRVSPYPPQTAAMPAHRHPPAPPIVSVPQPLPQQPVPLR